MAIGQAPTFVAHKVVFFVCGSSAPLRCCIQIGQVVFDVLVERIKGHQTRRSRTLVAADRCQDICPYKLFPWLRCAGVLANQQRFQCHFDRFRIDQNQACLLLLAIVECILVSQRSFVIDELLVFRNDFWIQTRPRSNQTIR